MQTEPAVEPAVEPVPTEQASLLENTEISNETEEAPYSDPLLLQETPKVEEKEDPRLLLKDIFLAPTIQIPEDIEMTKAKSFLKSTNLYSHLASTILRLIETRPEKGFEEFETISANVKLNVEPSNKRIFKDVSLFPAPELYTPKDVEGELPDIIAINQMWNWAGVSLGDPFPLFLSLRSLMNSENLKSVRVWGKIYGNQQDYLIIEADGENMEIPQPAEAPEVEPEVEYATPKKSPVPVIPYEDGRGVNRYVYYVANSINGPWTKLPPVNPQKLAISRQIRTYFTGKLETPILSYPPFNDFEAQYLRCQIARITAATVICPTNYYSLDDEDKESKGRCEWANPFPVDEDAGDEEVREEAETVPETGPELLALVSADEEDFGKFPAWRATMCSRFLTSKYSPVVLQPSRWPGAHSIVYNDKFTNVYVGFGLKELENGIHEFVPLPAIQTEYGGEGVDPVVESFDATVDEERNFEDELQEKKELEEEEA